MRVPLFRRHSICEVKKQVIIRYDNGPCGSFKTTRCVREMALKPARYVYAVDRREVMQERHDKIVAMAAERGLCPIIKIVCSRSDKHNVEGVMSVTQEIARIPRVLDKAEHLIVIVTHEALKSVDWSPYEGFRLIIDEVPTVWYHEQRQTPALAEHFRANYDLAPTAGAYAKVVARSTVEAVDREANAVTLRDYQTDEIMRTFAVFHRRAMTSDGVHVDLNDWSEMALPDRKWSWYSIFNIRELEHFGSIWIVGNAFEHSLFYRLIVERALDPENPEFGIEFRPLPDNHLSQEWQRRKLRIRYFAENHVAGSNLWSEDSSPYQDAQHKWADWIARHSDPDNHYWTANLRHVALWSSAAAKDTPTIPGIAISPKCSGDNRLRDITVASVCYSAKAKPAEKTAYKVFNITGDMIKRAREYEDLIQIAFRSSLRVAADTRDVEIRVYDRAQAEFLRDYLDDAGFPFDVDLIYTDIGIDDVVRKTRKEHDFDRALAGCRTEEDRRKKAEWMMMTPAQKAAKRRADKRAAEIAAGKPVRSRGRPKKGA